MLYSLEFNGLYPVGAVAVVVADSPSEAKELLRKELETNHPGCEFDDSKEPIKINSRKKAAYILLDGDY